VRAESLPEDAGMIMPSRALSPTEERNPRTADIDTLPTEDVLRLLNAEDATVPGAVARAIPVLAAVVDQVADCVRSGGHVHYFGAGTSGRMAALDAAEVVPTFGLDPTVFVAHHAGGEAALGTAIEDVEDNSELGASDAAEVSAADVAIGITASGATPYVRGALAKAKAAEAVTVLITSNPAAPLQPLADYVVVTDTGPEAIGGSTRLKAATAQKLALNALSTAAMIRLGRTYSNLMVSLSSGNEKLRRRQITILMQATGATEEACRSQLADCGGDLRLALLCLLSGLPPESAAKALREANGSVRAALSGRSAPA
jgi:N-acetylmuramic acid 6-phosphate etherase